MANVSQGQRKIRQKWGEVEQYPDDDDDGEVEIGGVSGLSMWPPSQIASFSLASGGKDRHGSVITSKGPRDRRVRLSVSTAIQFYDLQDRLGFDQPSKAVEWLLKAASKSIDELSEMNTSNADTPTQLSDETRPRIMDSAEVELDIPDAQPLASDRKRPADTATTQPSRYEFQKRRDWNTFGQYLKSQSPPVALSQCTSNHVLNFLRFLDQFGKTKVHLQGCGFFGQPEPPGPCTCPLRQAWGSLDALIGRLRAAYEENSLIGFGRLPETNPFASGAIRLYLRAVRDSQLLASGRKRPADAAIEMGKKTVKLDLHDTAGKQKVMKTVVGLSPSGFRTPDKQNLSTPDPSSREEEDSKPLQLQMHQYSDATFSLSDCGSNSGTAPEGGALYMEELVRLNEMGEVAPKGQKLSPEVSHSSEEDLLEEMWSEELEETPSDPRELEDLNCDPMEVPPTISHHFCILHVLDLSYTEIKSLPQSISRLVALQKLFLRSCKLLMELPPEIGELSNLQVLDLEGTEILSLPKEIAKLVNLTCLKVSFYGYANKTVIPRRVLSNLSRLKELIIDVTPYGEWWDVEVEDIKDDLFSLDELRTLKLYLPTAKLLEGLTRIFSRLANFRFTVGRHEEHFISRLPRNVEEEFNNQEKLEKGLKYINGIRIPNEITEVFKHANAFFLQRHWTAKSLSEFGHENMNEVKFCLVMECNEFRTIIDSEQYYQGKDGRSKSEDFLDFDETIVLGSLQKMIIRYMKNMVSIWKGPIGKWSLCNLNSLALHTCPNLTTLFTIDVLSNLINLEELIVEDCPKIDSLVSLKSSNSKSGLFLPNLKKISLLELPVLVSISCGLWIAPKLETMVIFYCPKLEKLSAMDVSSTNLKVIKGEKEWWDALKWYESDLATEHEDYLARLFIPLRRDGDLMAQLTKD